MTRPRVRLVVMEADAFDHKEVFRQAFARLGVEAEIIGIPYFRLSEMTVARFDEIEQAIGGGDSDQVTFYCPGLGEIYARGADHGFYFSAYRSWFDPSAMTVIPHPWTPVGPATKSELVWKEKPALTAGFVGSSYGNSTVARWASRSPAWVRNYLLTGRHLRHPRLVAWLYQLKLPIKFLAAFPRFEALEAIERANRITNSIDLEITDTGGFTGSASQKESYFRHMLRTTYVLCPRGSENFSFRAFEALKFGRIPVIVDSDMVLPEEVPWRDVAIVAKYEDVGSLHQAILDDYKNDFEFFRRRQEIALDVSDRLSGERWIDDSIKNALLKSYKIK